MDPINDLSQQLDNGTPSYGSLLSQLRQRKRDYDLQQIALALRHQCNVFKVRVALFCSRPTDAPGNAERCTLCNKENGLTALFRYCAAVTAGCN